jgi:polyhydroxybutyrate depolymerase
MGKRALIVFLLIGVAGVGLSAVRKSLRSSDSLFRSRTSWVWADGVTQKFTVAGVERTALVYGNTAPAPKSGSPLVIVFHGHGGTSQFAARKFDIHNLWREAVVIYPQGLPSEGIYDPEGKRNGWQKGVGTYGDRDLQFFDALLDWAKKTYAIDAKRIYVAGHSNGGSMTYLLWATRADKIAAFAPCSSVFGMQGRQAKPKPAIIFAGDQDNVVPFQMQERSINFVLKLNQCDTSSGEFDKVAKLYKSKKGADVVTYIYPGGHPLPSNTGELIVAFFKQYALNGA